MVFFITDGEGDALRTVKLNSPEHPIFLRAVLEGEESGKFKVRTTVDFVFSTIFDLLPDT